MGKLPSNLTLDELLKALENVNDESVQQTVIESSTGRNNSDVLLFLTTLKINKGDKPIKKILLYKLYDQWSKEPVSQNSFTMKLSYYIDTTKYHYLINENDFSLTNKVKKLLDPIKDRTKSKDQQKHFKYFLDKFKIKEGNSLFVEGYILFYIYDNWNFGNNKRNALGYKAFINMMKLYVPFVYINKTNRLFGLNESIRETLTPEYLIKAKEWGTSRYKFRKPKRRKKKHK
jgi:hypothetical protein